MIKSWIKFIKYDYFCSNVQFKRRLLVADAHTEQNRTFSELDAVTTKLIEHLPQ